MLVVVASPRDRVAARLVEHWGPATARLLTSRDLSRPGWRYRPGCVSRSIAVIAGERVPAAHITGVVVRLPFVPVEDLTHIVEADRQYVAREMTAVLTAWLSELRCPVVNRPTPVCLAGPGWSDARWRHTAARLGIPMARGAAHHTVTLVDNRSMEAAPGEVPARRLAQAAQLALMQVDFDDRERVVRVNPWPDVSRPEVAAALLEWFAAA